VLLGRCVGGGGGGGGDCLGDALLPQWAKAPYRTGPEPDPQDGFHAARRSPSTCGSQPSSWFPTRENAAQMRFENLRENQEGTNGAGIPMA
jgi:hypothetical protein